jgi:3-oxoacyl-[acyl-carrier protein] reductase
VMLLKNKSILIPGASRPIGRAIARKFGTEGALLILPHYDWPESTKEMIAEFKAAKFSFFTFPVDLRDEDSVKQLVVEIKNHTDHLNFLINNIERGGMPVVHGGYDLDHNKDQWDLEIATTLKAKWLLYRHCLPLMQNNPSGGSIVNISSISALTGRSGPGAFFFNDGYSAVNRAIQSFTESWSREVAPDIRVNELMLGLIESRHGPGTLGWKTLTEQEKNEIHDHILLKRTGHPEEVAKAVFFLAVEADYVTGSILKMDGGFTLGGAKVPPLPRGVL